MTETFFPTSAPDLADETLREQVSALGLQIVELQSNLQSMTKNWEFQRDRAIRMADQIKTFHGYLKEHLFEGSLDSEIAKTYADIFDLTLTKKYDVSVTVTFSGTVEVPLDIDESDIPNEVSFLLDEGYSDLEWDMTEDDVDWDIQEAY